MNRESNKVLEGAGSTLNGKKLPNQSNKPPILAKGRASGNDQNFGALEQDDSPGSHGPQK